MYIYSTINTYFILSYLILTPVRLTVLGSVFLAGPDYFFHKISEQDYCFSSNLGPDLFFWFVRKNMNGF